MKELGNRIREARKTKRMNIDELANQVGIVPSYLVLIEEGRRRPGVKTLRRICEILEIDFEAMPAVGDNIKELGNRIRAARKQKEIRVKKITEMIGMTQTGYYQIEQGRHRPRIQSLMRICKILELDLLEMCTIGNYPRRVIKEVEEKLSNEKSSDKKDISNIIDTLSEVSNQDFELLVDLLNSISRLTQKEKDILKDVLS